MGVVFSSGTITGILAFLAVVAGLLGKPALGTFLSNPDTAASALQAVGAVGALVAGILRGWGEKPPAA